MVHIYTPEYGREHEDHVEVFTRAGRVLTPLINGAYTTSVIEQFTAGQENASYAGLSVEEIRTRAISLVRELGFITECLPEGETNA